MTRAELIELLQVERFLPLPPAPRAGIPVDSKKEQDSRKQELDAAVQSFDEEHRHEAPALRRKGMILVAVKEDAA